MKPVRYLKPAVLRGIRPDQSVVVEASAGTGKTHLLEHLVVERVLERGDRIDQILVVTYTEKGAAELRHRIRAKLAELLGASPENGAAVTEPHWLIDDAARDLLRRALRGLDAAAISTIHAFCQRVLTNQAFRHRRLLQQTQVEERRSFSAAFKDCLRTVFAAQADMRDILAAWLESGRTITDLDKMLLSCLRARAEPYPMDDPKASPPDAPPVPLAAAVAARFLPVVRARWEERKARAGQYDFQDMLGLVAATLASPSGNNLANELRNAFRCALIDEFQDTDEVQWSIFRRVFLERASRSPIVLIGDPKQAIYGFRGADVFTYLDARQGLPAVRLDESFRATPELLDAQNVLFDQAAAEPFFLHGIRYEGPLRCGRPDLRLIDADGQRVPAICVLRVVPSGDKLRSGAVRRVIRADFCREIKRLLGPPVALRIGPEGEERPLRPRDIFVLTRTLVESLEVGEALRQTSVPHAFYKQDGLFQTPEAAEVRDLLAAVDEPNDRSARLRAWITPFFGLSLEDLATVHDLPQGHALVQRLWDWKALAASRDYEALFQRIFEESGILRRQIFAARERELTNYQHLFEMLLAEATRTRGTLRELVQALTGFITGTRPPPGEEADVQRLESERDAVQIMTMHKAKGLEAAVVFLYGGYCKGHDLDMVHVVHRARAGGTGHERLALVGRLTELPEDLAGRVKQEVEDEERRLLYVALTRARGRVYVAYFPAATRANGTRGECFPTMNGCHKHLNDRLRALLDAPGRREDVAATGNADRLFAETRLQCPDPTPSAPAVLPSLPTDLAGWRPDPELVAEPVSPTDFDAVRDRHRGFVVTSYTRLKAAAGGYRPPPEQPEPGADEIDGSGAAPREELPGGLETGRMLHGLMEEMPLDSLREAPPLPAWRVRPEIEALFERRFRRHGADRRYLPHAQALVHQALTAPIPLDGALMPGLAMATTSVREMEFVYPIPEGDHPPLGVPPEVGAGLRVDRGFIKGVIDLLFEHEGRTYLVDWKSDGLADSSADALSRHVRANYDLQARLYALALVKMLRISNAADHARRFGGVLFCFVREMRSEAAGRGVHFGRPGWAELVDWDVTLRGTRLAGTAAPEGRAAP